MKLILARFSDENGIGIPNLAAQSALATPKGFYEFKNLTLDDVTSLLQQFGLRVVKNEVQSRERLLVHLAEKHWKAENMADEECDGLMRAILDCEYDRIAEKRVLKLNEEFGALDINFDGAERGYIFWVLRQDVNRRLNVLDDMWKKLKRAKKKNSTLSIMWDAEPPGTPKAKHKFI